MTIPRNEGDITEEQITKLVKIVRETGCDSSFCKLYGYLESYISIFERKYKIPGHDCDEVKQECLFALRYKAIKDFDSERGKFKSFAVLCMKRHLFSIIKGSNQHKRRVLNDSLSLDEERSGEFFSLSNIVSKVEPSAEDNLVKNELYESTKEKLLSILSKLEKEVLKLYLEQLSYEQITYKLNKSFPKKRFTKKSVDNSLTRIRFKAQNMCKDPFSIE